MHECTDEGRGGPPVLRIHLLGTFRVCSGDRSIDEDGWRLRNAARLVKRLALAPNFALHREVVTDELWPDLDMTAASNNLRYTMHVARRTLRGIVEHDVLQRRGEQIVLCPDDALAIEVDSARFEALALIAQRTGDPADYERALSLYSGDLLPDDRYEDWAAVRRESLRSMHFSLLADLALARESAGDLDGATAILEQVLSFDPASEDAHVGLMRVYAARGQRQHALRQYRLLQITLREELDADPEPSSQRLYQEILTGRRSDPSDVPRGIRERPSTPATQPGRHNLPFNLTSFVGREREIATLRDALNASRLITLVGAGGSGKTRLAIEVAHRVAAGYRDGAWLVDLSALGDAALVPDAVAEMLGIAEDQRRPLIDALIDRLASRSALILIDNCEHVIDACASLASTVLQRCPGVVILATSRERLNVDGEQIWQVRPLAIPGPESDLPSGDLARVESVQLFVERAALVQSGFTIKPENAAAIGRICRRLDGMPLAIELAASRAGVLSAGQLDDRLDDALGVLVDGSRTKRSRHQTLRAMLDWSYDLLPDAERMLLRRVSVFAGGWSLEDAEAVCAGDGIDQADLLSHLAQLVYKSLVVVDAGSEAARYRLLEVVRQYAAERLEQSGEVESVRQRHALRFLDLAETAELYLTGPDQAIWLGILEIERENLRAALAWTEHADPERALRLAAALGRFWWTRGHYTEARATIIPLLDRVSRDCSPETRSRALMAAFHSAYRQGDYADARALCEESLAILRRINDRRGVASALGYLAMVIGELGDIDHSRELLEESLELCTALDDREGLARAHNSLGEIARIRRDIARAEQHYRHSLVLWREIGDRQYIAIVLHNLGHLASARGDGWRAGTHFRESLALNHELGNLDGVASCLAGFGSVAAIARDDARAARLFGAADALHRAIATPEDTADYLEIQRHLTEVCAALGETRFQAAWTEGRELSLEQAIDEARGGGAPSPASTGSATETPLSARERQVAALVAQGLTNQGIAQKLGIANRTVDTHVGNILRKLGLSSRQQIGAWISAASDDLPS